MHVDDLDERDVSESILSARSIAKTMRSISLNRSHAGEKLYVIKSANHQGTPIYTKGRFGQEGNQEVFYVLISAKIDRAGDY